MNIDPAAKVILITGASSGIGKATATYFSKKGLQVFGTSRNPAKYHLEFPLIRMDVTDPLSVRQGVELVLERAGRIDVLINNAGVGITGPIEETPDREIEKAFEINVFGPLRVTKAVLPAMRKRRVGSIINITSIAGYMGLPYRGIYSATKAALEMTTEALRMELKEFHIEVTNVAPGDFATNIAAGRYHAPVGEDSPYKTSYSRTLQIMNEHVDSGEDPEKLADFLFKLVQNKQPKIHYRVGEPLQKFSIILKKILPDKMYERLLLKHYKL